MKLKLIQLMTIIVIAVICLYQWSSKNISGLEQIDNTKECKSKIQEEKPHHIQGTLQQNCNPICDGLTLFSAVYREDLEHISLFLWAGVNPSITEDTCWAAYPYSKDGGHDKWTALHLAAFNGNTRIISMLLNAGAPVDAIDSHGMPPLHWAAFSGDRRWVDYSLGVAFWNYDLDVSYGYYCLTYTNCLSEYESTRQASLPPAPNIKHREASALLLERGARLNARDTYGQTPLHIAAYVGNAPLVEMLIKKGSQVNSPDKNGRTPLHLAAWGNHLEVMKLLLSAGASPVTLDKQGFTPLHLTVSRRKDTSNAIKELISHGADINVRAKSGETPLFCVRNIESAETLISSGADVKAKDNEGRTALHRLVSGYRIPSYLCWDLETKDRYKLLEKRWRLFSTDGRECEMMDLLLEKGVGIDDRDKQGVQAIQYAVRFDNESSMLELISSNACVSGLDERRRNLLHCIADRYKQPYSEKSSWCASIDALIKKGLDINARDSSGATPLDYAIWNGDTALMNMLKVKRGKISMALPEIAENAAKHGNTGELKKLINIRPEFINRKGLRGSTVLHISSEEGHLECCKAIISRGGDVNARNGFLETPLMRAVEKNNISVASFLMDRGADIDCRDCNDRTIQSIAAHENNIQMLEALCRRMESKDIKTAFTSLHNGSTLLHELAESGHTGAVGLLLRKGIDINTRDAEGRTPLICAISSNSCGLQEKIKMAELLINCGADVNARDNDGKTALYEACCDNGDYEEYYNMAKMLISHGADVNYRVNGSSSPLHVASDPRITDLLIRNGADVNIRNKEGETPLCVTRNEESIRLLTLSEADVNAVNKFGETPLFYAVREDRLEGARILLSNGADVDARNPFGSTPLLEAVKENNSEMVELLVSSGADINAGDGLGRTPLTLAEKIKLEGQSATPRMNNGRFRYDRDIFEFLKAQVEQKQ
ncbi:MAG: ankyrin repeat domain-containing protein [Candidatus Xenobiia bacterium LiM19]